MTTSSSMTSGSNFDLEPDPYRESCSSMAGWDLSELKSANYRAESTDNSSSGAYFGGRRIKMNPASPESFPEPRTYPTGWDLSLMETGQKANEMEKPQTGFSIDWMHISINTASIKPVDLDAA